MRIIKFFVFFLLIIFLVSCDDESSDEIPPLIIGEDSIEIILNATPPDWTQYITATDDTDGLIQITVEMVDASDVNLSEVGVYEVKYTITDLEGNKSEYYLSVEVIDNIYPTISLVGEDTIFIEFGTTYQELGAIYDDNYDIDGTVIIGGDVVDPNVLGSYTITYNAVDASGNVALEITRTVNVVDTTSPTLNLNGDQIINLVYGEPYIEQGALYTDNYDIDGTVIIGGDVVNPNVLGSYTVTYNAVDASGNVALEITRTINVVDTTSPTLTLIGSQIINLEYGEPYVEQGVIYNDNHDIDGTVIIDGDVVDSSILASYTITYNTEDASGNEAVEVTRTVNVVDTTSPIITLIDDPVLYVIKDSSFTDPGAIVMDNYDQNVMIEVDGYVDINLVGEYVISYYAIDSEGNDTTVTRSIFVYEDLSNDVYESTHVEIYNISNYSHQLNLSLRSIGVLHHEARIDLKVTYNDSIILFEDIDLSLNTFSGIPDFSADILLSNVELNITYTFEVILHYENIKDEYDWTLETLDFVTVDNFNIYDIAFSMCNVGGFELSCMMHFHNFDVSNLENNEYFTIQLIDNQGLIQEFDPISDEDFIMYDFNELDYFTPYWIQVVYNVTNNEITISEIIGRYYVVTGIPIFIDGLIENQDGILEDGVFSNSATFNMIVYTNYNFQTDENNYLEYILVVDDNEINRGYLENIGFQWQELVLENLVSNTDYTLILQETFVYEGVQYSFITRYYFFTTKP